MIPCREALTGSAHQVKRSWADPGDQLGLGTLSKRGVRPVLSRAPVGAESVAPIARPVRRKGVPRAPHPPIPATLSRGICGHDAGAGYGSRSAYRCRVERGHGDPAGGAGEPLLRRERAQPGRACPAVARHEVQRRVGRRRRLAAELQGVQRRRDRPGRRRQQRHLVGCDQAGALRAVLGPVELPGRSVDDPLHTARSRGQRDVLDLVRRPRRVAEGLRRRPQGRVQRRRAAVVAGRR